MTQTSPGICQRMSSWLRWAKMRVLKNGHVRVRTRVLKTLACRKKVGGFFELQHFPRVTSIGSVFPKTLGKLRGPQQNPAEPRRTLRETLGETPTEPSERQISSESLAEGCAPRMVTIRNFRISIGRQRVGAFSNASVSKNCL